MDEGGNCERINGTGCLGVFLTGPKLVKNGGGRPCGGKPVNQAAGSLKTSLSKYGFTPPPSPVDTPAHVSGYILSRNSV